MARIIKNLLKWGWPLLLVATLSQAAVDYPHAGINGITCYSCHDVHADTEKFLRLENPHAPQHIDDSPANNLCWSCHNNDIAPFVNPHSSRMIDEDYGQWAIECRTCHNPHKQDQFRAYEEVETLLTSGTITGITNTTITSTGAGWAVDEFKGLIVLTRYDLVDDYRTTMRSYRIVSNTVDTLTVGLGNSGDGIDLSKADVGDQFAVIYGKLFKAVVKRPDRGQPINGDYTANGATGDTCSVTDNVFSCTTVIETVPKFLKDFRGDNKHAFAGDVDGDGQYQGPCEICHTRTRHHRNNNDWPAKADHTHNVGIKCTLCHKHENGFLPLGAGAHDVHLVKDFGPKITCSDGDWGCHGTYVPGANFPNEVLFSDGLALCDGRPDTDCPNTGSDTGTQVCANCHGEGSLLAKYYFFRPGSSEGDAGLWITPQSGNYTWDDTWLGQLGEEKFCGSCHNETNNPSPVVGPKHPSDNNPPNVVGDLDLDTGASTYGFFANGHGKKTGNYQRLSWQDDLATGNPAANKICSDCHDYTKGHWSNPDPNDKRLKAGYENDGNNTVCVQCHQPAGIADADPKWFTDHGTYDNSAHGADDKQNIKCSTCHDPHGAAGQDVGANGETNPAMTKGYKQGLCFRCHSDTGDLMNVQNFAIAGYRGSHDGANGSVTLNDADGEYNNYSNVVGWTVFNLTDGSSGVVTDPDPATYRTIVTATLTGGTDNDWDTGDQYHIVFNSGAEAIDNIEDAFNFGNKHDLGTAFVHDGKNYTLQCISCHNVHLVTGQFWEADQGKSPVSKFPPVTGVSEAVWGDEAGEKMDDYDGGIGTYRTPKSDIFTGNQLPSYPDFCLGCHGQPQANHARFGITDWAGGDPHGTQSANNPNGFGTCPNWYPCGKSEGWDGDLCVAENPDDCWPVIIRGRGDQIFSRAPYNHEERIAGANFKLSCTDCHEAHGSGNSSMIRVNPNRGTGTWVWNDMCNNCHYYYSDWHAGMSCGTASCHTANSIHRMGNKVGTGMTRTWDPDLVMHLAFQNNLKDSGTWQMDSKWMDNIAGTYIAGKVGNAIQLNGGMNVQVGTENDYWSTDAGRHGTWITTEMKFNTTLEAWVRPTDDANSEYSIFTKHVGYGNGGYAFVLKKIDGTLRATFNMQADNNGTVQDGIAGIRGAYSSLAIPLNTWTHVAAVFDENGLDRDGGDPSIGRIRIYVNGEDVTTSDASGNNMQPGTNETSIFAYPENSGWNEGPANCYDGTWCAGEFSVGGFYGWQNEFIGGIDEAKVWNISKDAAYFTAYDPMAGPYISTVEGVIGGDTLTVTFSEGVYSSTGSSGNLVAGDFVLIDTDNNRFIQSVSHTAGSRFAELTLSSAIDGTDDMFVDTLAPATGEIFDENDVAGSTTAATLKPSSACPPSPVTFNLNESSGSSYVLDTQAMLAGEVFGGAAALTGSEFSGNGTDAQYIMFDNNTSCLHAADALSLEVRIKPTGITADDVYVQRVLARDGGGNYQMSVWRNNTWANYQSPTNETSIALWVRPVDSHGGSTWKVVLTNYTGAATGGENECPIVSDHWYQVKAIWDTEEGNSTIGIPAKIYIDDQGEDGLGFNENWSGYLDCTDADQSLNSDTDGTDPVAFDPHEFYKDDTIFTVNSNFSIGVNRGNTANHRFNGLIDWIIWKDTVDPPP